MKKLFVAIILCCLFLFSSCKEKSDLKHKTTESTTIKEITTSTTVAETTLDKETLRNSHTKTLTELFELYSLSDIWFDHYLDVLASSGIQEIKEVTVDDKTYNELRVLHLVDTNNKKCHFLDTPYSLQLLTDKEWLERKKYYEVFSERFDFPSECLLQIDEVLKDCGIEEIKNLVVESTDFKGSRTEPRFAGKVIPSYLVRLEDGEGKIYYLVMEKSTGDPLRITKDSPEGKMWDAEGSAWW